MGWQLFRFIDNWRRFLVTGEKPLPITGTFTDVEPAYQVFTDYANDNWGWLVEDDDDVAVDPDDDDAEDVSDGEAADPAHDDDEANRD
jgi:hypothetical protein